MTTAIEERVKNVIVDSLGVDRGVVLPNAHFINDLGADSLDTVELVMALEEEFSVEIPDAEAEQIHTLEGVVEAINKRGAK